MSKDHQTMPLFAESIEDALKTAVAAMGGSKVVGAKMRPEKLADAAGTWLSDCLNHDKRDKLDLEQVMWLLREARQHGCHQAIHWICQECGYTAPQAIEPDDEKAQLMREFIEATKSAQKIVDRIERINGVTIRAVA
jgi:hypothetical protein